MNEVKLSTQIKSKGEQKLTIKFDPKALGVSWGLGDHIRVRCYKKEGRLTLERVARRYERQIAYKVTSMGHGDYSHNVGIYVTRRNTRFAHLVQTHMKDAAVRRLDNSRLELYLPKEIFAQPFA